MREDGEEVRDVGGGIRKERRGVIDEGELVIEKEGGVRDEGRVVRYEYEYEYEEGDV